MELLGEKHAKEFNKGSALFMSTVVPGLGQTKIRKGKPWWLASLPVYGALAGGYVLHQSYLSNYDAYINEKTNDVRRNDLFDKAQMQMNLSGALFISAAHTLLISDACFGGSILKTRAAFNDAGLAINMLYDLKSRKAMTSGTLTEVPDQSAFLKYMVDRLITNTFKYLPSEQLFSSFRIAVINNSSVVPQFGVIQDVGDEGGDFIFILRE